MSTIINTYTDDNGHVINEYESGVKYNMTTKTLAKGSGSPKPITRENAHIYTRARQEKTARLIREKLVASHNSMMPNPATSSAEVIAEGAAMLYEGIVLNTEAYPRDRLDAWEKLGKYSQTLPADIKAVDDTSAVQAVASAVTAGTAQVLAQVLADVMRVQRERAVDAVVVEQE